MDLWAARESLTLVILIALGAKFAAKLLPGNAHIYKKQRFRGFKAGLLLESCVFNIRLYLQ